LRGAAGHGIESGSPEFHVENDVHAQHRGVERQRLLHVGDTDTYVGEVLNGDGLRLVHMDSFADLRGYYDVGFPPVLSVGRCNC
jgi:hypothetical protein